MTGTVAAIPEASSWAMLLAGFAGLAFAGYQVSRRVAPSWRKIALSN
jgi:hypothetical protein